MSKKIFFDLDGTLYDLYNVENWLESLQNEDATVFERGNFIGDYDEFISIVKELMFKGYTFGVISWLPMQASPEYEEVCRKENIAWINNFLPFVTEINIVPYGIPKQNAIQKRAKTMYLIDDSAEVCKMWETPAQRKAININEEFTVIDALHKLIENE